MFAERPMLRWLAIGLAAFLLAGTHWFAFKRGAASEHRRTEAAAQNVFADWQAADFDLALQMLRLLERHQDALPPEERAFLCRRIKADAKWVETIQVRRYRELGNDPQADRWQQKVTEARGLIAKVEPSLK